MGWGTYRRSNRAEGGGLVAVAPRDHLAAWERGGTPDLHRRPDGREEQWHGSETGESRGGHERIGVRPNKPDLTAVNPVRQPPCHVTPASGAHLPETWLTSAKREISAPRHEHTSKDVVMRHFPQKL